MAIPFKCPHCGEETLVSDEYAGQSGSCRSCGKTVTIPGPAAAAAPMAAKSSSSRLPIILILLAACGLLVPCSGVLTALLLPAVQAAREAARRTQCANNLKQIGLAMLNYHEAYKTFPPAYLADGKGKPMHSWRVLLLPYLEERSLYEQYDFDQPWDSPQNMAVARVMPQVYQCPSSGGPGSQETSYMVLTGKGAVFDGEKTFSLANVKDGTSNTILAIEASNGSVLWTQPSDVDISQWDFQIGSPSGQVTVGSHHPGGLQAVLADGSVRFLSASTPPDTLRSMTTPAGGETVWIE